MGKESRLEIRCLTSVLPKGEGTQKVKKDILSQRREPKREK